jgi:hypothetical protein
MLGLAESSTQPTARPYASTKRQNSAAITPVSAHRSSTRIFTMITLLEIYGMALLRETWLRAG